MTERPNDQRREMADARNEIAQPCLHCKHLLSAGGQFDPNGWTCEAYPEAIPYSILTLRTPHTEASEYQPGMLVRYEPEIYSEAETGKQWHYNADGSWQYADDRE